MLNYHNKSSYQLNPYTNIDSHINLGTWHVEYSWVYTPIQKSHEWVVSK